MSSRAGEAILWCTYFHMSGFMKNFLGEWSVATVHKLRKELS